MIEESFYCILCNKLMQPTQEIAECSFCGKKEIGDYICPEGHYVCEECRTASPEEIVKKVCISTHEKDPMKIALLLMKHPAIQLYGPEHHFLVSCVLLAALRNLGKFNVDKSVFEEAIKRGKRMPLGSCGFLGACGAAVGVGIAISVATKATWTSDRDRSMAMQATSEVLSKIAEIGGPRCCKASVFAAMETAAKLLQREFNIKIPRLINLKPCYFKTLNTECLGNRCPYFR
jgi:hypothetical protein